MDLDKLIRLQIARTGTFGADGRTITAQDLQEVLDTFDGRAPVSLGHYAARQDWMPSWGNVENLVLETSGDGQATLVADISIREVLWEAIKSGFYPGWSVSIPVKPDGKHYLHHLAFLGAMPPAIRDLKIIKSADGEMPSDAVKVESEDISPSAVAEYSFGDFPEEGRAREVVQDNEDDGQKEETEQESTDETEEETSTPEETEKKDVSKDDFSDNAGEPASDVRIDRARKVFSASVKARLDAAMEGRIPAGLKDKVHEFADLALTNWDFSDEAQEPRIITLFEEILSSVKALPKTGRMDFSDHRAGDGEPKPDPARMASRF